MMKVVMISAFSILRCEMRELISESIYIKRRRHHHTWERYPSFKRLQNVGDYLLESDDFISNWSAGMNAAGCPNSTRVKIYSDCEVDRRRGSADSGAGNGSGSSNSLASSRIST
jgi:hypothetical protein